MIPLKKKKAFSLALETTEQNMHQVTAKLSYEERGYFSTNTLAA